MNRRLAIGALAITALASCAPGGTSGSHVAGGSITPLKPAASGAPIAPVVTLPTPQSPQPEGKLTLIWFHDYD